MVYDNSRKSAILQKAVFQNGLRFENKAICGEIAFQGFLVPKSSSRL